MQLHELKPIHKRKSSQRVGRGGKRGTYSGRGVKGQKARSGRLLKPTIRELIKKYPKLRGYKFSKQAKNRGLAVLNLDILEKNFKDGEIVNPKTLSEKRLIRKTRGRIPDVKILGDGKIIKALTFEGCLISKQAKEKIEKVNGLVK